MIRKTVEMEKKSEKKEFKMFLLEMANLQDNLLQSYRNIFIASQTIVVSIATLIVAFSTYPYNSTFIFELIIFLFQLDLLLFVLFQIH